MKYFLKHAIILLLLLASNLAQATIINYSVSESSATGAYEYSITNDSLGFAIFEVSIYFDYTIFALDGLLNPVAPAGWDPLVIGPPGFVSDDGFYDVLSLDSTGLEPGATLGGFSVDFALQQGKTNPGSQFFEVLDPNTFEVLDSGFTTLAPVPVPAALWLFASGIIGLSAICRRKVKS